MTGEVSLDALLYCIKGFRINPNVLIQALQEYMDTYSTSLEEMESDERDADVKGGSKPRYISALVNKMKSHPNYLRMDFIYYPTPDEALRLADGDASMKKLFRSFGRGDLVPVERIRVTEERNAVQLTLPCVI